MKTVALFYIGWFWCLIVSVAFLLAYGVSSAYAQEIMGNQQTIVQFNAGIDESTLEKSDQIESRLMRWEEQTGVQFDYIRPFGAKGWVIVIQDKLNPDRLAEVIEQLNQEPMVKYAEIDAVMSISPPKGGFGP